MPRYQGRAPCSSEASTDKVAIPICIRSLPAPASCNPDPIASAAGASELVPADCQRVVDSTWTAVEMDHEELVDSVSAEYLKEVAGTDDIENLTYLELTIDTTEQSVEPLGTLLPSIQQLKLNHSHLASFRDLGTQLRHLRILWLNRSGVTELDGVGALTGLCELYLAFNSVSDLTPLAMHEELQVLDLDTNEVADASQLDQLGTCPKLVSLCLDHNPVCRLRQYRRVVIRRIPNLSILDDNEVTDADCVRPDAEAEAMAATPVKRTNSNGTRGNVDLGLDLDGSLGEADSVGALQDLGVADELGSGTGVASSDAEYTILARSIRAQPIGAGTSDSPALSSSPSSSGRPQTAALGACVSGLGGGASIVGQGVSAGAGSSSALARPMTAAGCGRADSALAAALERRHERTMDSSTAGSGSSLTHGSDVVFAGSAVRALRAHQLQRSNSREGRPGTGDSAHSLCDGDDGGAAGSITGTLEKAADFDARLRRASTDRGSQSRDEVLAELKAWNSSQPSATVVMALADARSGMSQHRRPQTSSATSRRKAAGATGASNGIRNSGFDGVRASLDSQLGLKAAACGEAIQFGHGFGRELCLDGGAGGRAADVTGRARSGSSTGRTEAISARTIRQELLQQEQQERALLGEQYLQRPGTAFVSSRPCIRPGTAQPNFSSPARRGPRAGARATRGSVGMEAQVLILDDGTDGEESSSDEDVLSANSARDPETLRSQSSANSPSWARRQHQPWSSVHGENEGAAQPTVQPKSSSTTHSKAPSGQDGRSGLKNGQRQQERVMSTAELAKSIAAEGVGGLSLQAFLQQGAPSPVSSRPAGRFGSSGSGSSDEDEDDLRSNTSSQRFGRRNSSMANAIASGLAAIERWNDALDADEHGDDCEKRAGKATNHIPSSSAAAAMEPEPTASSPSSSSPSSSSPSGSGAIAPLSNTRTELEADCGTDTPLVGHADIDRKLPSQGTSSVALAKGRSTVDVVPSTSGPKGAANNASDAELVELLRRKPKTTPELRTTQAFRKFFNGIQHGRLLRLLNLAYASLDDASREQKVQKRMRLMKGHTCIVAVDEGENGAEMVEAVPLSV